jgi:hypothetical protein
MQRKKLSPDRALWLASLAVVAIGCSSSSKGSSPPPAPFSLGNINPAANDPSALSPFDATPDLTGQNVYFTAVGANGPGVFTVPAKGGTPTPLAVGAPFVTPLSIALSSDGQTLFIADPGADTATGEAGAVFSVPVGGGMPSEVAGTDGMVPRGLEVAGDQLYFTGTGSDGKPGLFKMPVAGGGLATLASGATFHEPSGVAIDKAGNVYVVDAASPMSQSARIVLVPPSGSPSTYVDQIAVGYPAGIVLNQAESVILVSALDTGTGTDAVLVIDVASKNVTEMTAGIDKFVEPAGLHRAHGADVFAWADSTANKTGTVYVLSH